MSKVYKAIILLSSLAVILMVGRFVFASNSGYFLEKNNNLYILDNLHINGYLAVENTLSTATGKLGDVLIGEYLLLDESNNLYFCEDIRVPKVNTPLNKDCNSKILIWTPDSLEIKSDRYQLVANKLSAPNGTINFQPASAASAASGKNVQTKYPVKLTGCFSNDGSNTCENSEVKSGNIYLKTLSALSAKTGLSISAQTLHFTGIDLGPEKNINNQWICWKAGLTNSCKTAFGGAYASDRWTFAVSSLGTTYTHVKDNNTLQGSKLCCHLKVTF